MAAAGYRCQCVTDWVVDKTRWGLSIDAAEHVALSEQLSHCADVPVTVVLARDTGLRRMAKRLNAPGGGCLETGPRHVLAAQGAAGSTQRGSSGSPSPSGRASMGPVVLGVREAAVLGEHRLHDASIAPGGVRRHDGQGTDAVLVRRSDRREFNP
ncbi:hypothetical protein ACPCAG_19360 [Streptomyces pseudogriseolus]|uniref:hypothetical protein n=1 Tax=Streptomyces pseudogriseolus TaxID=36817 RepID=UPI003FA2B389